MKLARRIAYATMCTVVFAFFAVAVLNAVDVAQFIPSHSSFRAEAIWVVVAAYLGGIITGLRFS
jgi:hypothetical protein